MSDLHVDSAGDLLLEDHHTLLLHQLHKALSIPQDLLGTEESTKAEIEMQCEAYLGSLKDQGLIESFSIAIGNMYVITSYHITKQGRVIEHRRECLSGWESDHFCDHYLIAKLQGPHKPRRALHKVMKRWILGSTLTPVHQYVQPVKPVDFIKFTINVEPYV